MFGCIFFDTIHVSMMLLSYYVNGDAYILWYVHACVRARFCVCQCLCVYICVLVRGRGSVCECALCTMLYDGSEGLL